MIKLVQSIFNHEIWHKCTKCGGEYDLRSTTYCSDCGHQWKSGDPI